MLNQHSEKKNWFHISCTEPMTKILLKFFDKSKIISTSGFYLHCGPLIIPGDQNSYLRYAKWLTNLWSVTETEKLFQQDNYLADILAHIEKEQSSLQSLNNRDVNVLCWVDESLNCENLLKYYLSYFYNIKNIYFIDYNYLKKNFLQTSKESITHLFQIDWTNELIEHAFKNKLKLSEEDIVLFKSKWKALDSSKNFIRVLENGKVLGFLENYYDKIIVEQTQKQIQTQNLSETHSTKLKGFVRLSLVYGFMMEEHQLSDIFVLSRFIKLINEKIIMYQEFGDVEPGLSQNQRMLKHYMIQVNKEYSKI